MGARAAGDLTWGYHCGSPRTLSLPLSVSRTLPLSPPISYAHTQHPLWESLLGVVMATLQQNCQDTFMLTSIPDQVLILSEAEAAGRTLKPRALCRGPSVG